MNNTTEFIDKLVTIMTDDLLNRKPLNYIDWIAMTRGWNPLVVNEEMQVSFGEKIYVIKRVN